jgi:hypothetical protein
MWILLAHHVQKLGFISKHKESLDNLLLTLVTYLNGDVHRAIHDL